MILSSGSRELKPMPGHWTEDVFIHISNPGKEALLLSSEVQDGLTAANAVGGLDEMENAWSVWA